MQPKRANALSAADLATIIQQLDFGSTLSDQLISQLAGSAVALDLRRRRFVYRAGDPADSLYAIVHGTIKLCRIDHDT